MRYLISIFAAALLMASPAMAKKPSKKAVAANVEAMEIGKQLYLHDQAAWHGTDALAEKVDLSAQPELRGYLVDPLDNGNLGLVFFGEDDQGHYEFARYEVAGSKVVGGGLQDKADRIALSPLLERMVAARTAAIDEFQKRDWGFCTDSSAKFIGLPPDQDGVIKAYLLTSTKDANVYPFGGHYRIDIGPDGKVVAARKFTNSCLNMGGGKNAEGLLPVALGISHILDDHPTELHYFQSYYIPMKVAVIIKNDVWEINRGEFEKVENIDGK
jgi:hypothetical protein